MSIEIPFYRQEKSNTCALACLRMVLAAYGTDVPESVLENEAHVDHGGTAIGELERLARKFGLTASIRQVTIDELQQLLSERRLPIAFIDRAVFGLRPAARARHSLRAARIHTVIPTRISTASITFHDPLLPRPVRKSARLFGLAYERLGSYAVICSKR